MAERLEIVVHKMTKVFPSDELYRSIDQIRRSSASVSNNIAEGYNRYSYKEKIRSCVIAKGEAEETKRNIIRSAKKEFLNTNDADIIADQYTDLIKAISGYINFLYQKSGKST